ncbi:hypothetical protein DU500_12340 [Haloplanus rubicundus]|uniref:Uncharacterized protein n=1 Tax=Haloplanus rubicundus TaxID=1547898 RepID=A0A345E4M6_9EURY|nr:hypothetical protein DU500_12340 [Haloplanus rubicundus]
MGTSAVTLVFFSDGVLEYFEPEAILEEKVGTLASRTLVAMLVVGGMAVLSTLALQYRRSIAAVRCGY